MISNKKWYVIKTKSKQETKAIKNLINQGFETFCPFLPEISKYKKVISRINKPLFPSYIFTFFDIYNENWIKINNTYGVQYLLGNADVKPTSISSSFIDNLKSVCNEESCVNDYFFNFKENDKVKFINGPFINEIAEIITLDSKSRVLVLLNFFNNKIKVNVDRTNLVLA